jgi:hypothetical protein
VEKKRIEMMCKRRNYKLLESSRAESSRRPASAKGQLDRHGKSDLYRIQQINEAVLGVKSRRTVQKKEEKSG